MIGSALGRIAMAEKMSVNQLKEALQNKTLPAYIAIPLIEEKMNMQDRMASSAAMQQAAPQPPIADRVMQRAGTAGIDRLPSNLAPTQGMAGGGIVAFGGGGEIEKPMRFQNQGLVPKTQEEMDREDMMDTLRRMKAAGMDVLSLPVRGVAGAAESVVTRPLRALGVPIPYIPSAFYGGDSSSMTPYYDVIRRQDEAKAAAAAKPEAPKVDARLPDTAVAPPTPASKGTTGTPSKTSSGATGDRGIASRIAEPPKLPSYTGPSAGDITKGFIEGDKGYLARSEDREKRLMENLGKDRLQGKAFESYEKALRDEGIQAGLDKNQAKYMAMLKAGLAMMSGTSRHALENIGKGAMAGAVDYQEAYKDLRKAERERTKEFALIEQARRAEDRDDLKRRDELLMRASDASQKRDDFGTNALMSAGIEDTRAARDLWKTQYSAAFDVWKTKETIGAQERIAKERNAAYLSAAQARGAGRNTITPYQLAQLRKEAIKNVDEGQIRADMAKAAKLSKTPRPGEDASFDARVTKAYETKLNQYMEGLLGVSSGNPFAGYSLED
jgi:hypothetical protein